MDTVASNGCHAHGKTIKNLLHNRTVKDLETWYCNIGYSSATKFLKMMIFDLSTQRSILVPYAFDCEPAQMVDYSTFAVYNIKVDIYSKLTKYREIYMYHRSWSFFYFFTFVQGHSYANNFKQPLPGSHWAD